MLLYLIYTLTHILGSAAAGIQSGIGSVAAGSAFAILQSAGAGGAGLAVVNGVVQAAGAIVGATGLATKIKGQGDEHSANGDQEESDGTHEGNDAEEMVSKSKKNRGGRLGDKYTSGQWTILVINIMPRSTSCTDFDNDLDIFWF